MNSQEATALCAYVHQLCPQQRFNEHTPDVWGDVLAPYDFDEARAAVVAVASRQAFVAPAEIITEIRERRAERIELSNLVYDGDPLETGAQSAANIREIIRAAGDGLTGPSSIRASLGAGDRLALPPGADHGPYEGRAAAIRASIGKMPPRVREGVVNVRAVPCQTCQALPGASCTTRGRRRQDVHPSRLDDARRAAAGLPPVDAAEALQAQARIQAASAAALARDEGQEQEAEAS
ncbi:zinc finger domain-containing protein [Streptomyces cyslabdanicus]|uniref:zinc finger domain-containing protein n=1 Tax=Streptomyces cyslabdanicus TaxID=1470456 RepID=UPI004043FD7C